jgi:beta-glucosidase
VDVTNTGSRDGAETVQAYVAASQKLINRPIKELKGFQKVFLKAGSKKAVIIKLGKKLATSYWDEQREAWSSPAGTYNVLLGNSSDSNFLETSFEIEKTTWWTGL